MMVRRFLQRQGMPEPQRVAELVHGDEVQVLG